MRTRIAIVVVFLLVAAAVTARANRSETVVPRQAFSTFPMQLGPWRGVRDPPMADNVLKVLGADDYLTAQYLGPDRTVLGLYMGYWKSQRQGDAIHSPQNCLPGAGWQPTSTGTTTLKVSSDAEGTITVNRYLIQKGTSRQLVLYWYQSHGRSVASEYWSKLYLIADAMRLNRTDGAIVRVITPFGEAPDEERRADERVQAFISEFFPKLADYLPN